jgi:radical SAM protein with 4Fe4S-binding SPASM domain
MSLETAEEIKDQLLAAGFSGIVSITGRGEPTLHPQFKELVSIFADKPWRIKMHTNGKRFEKYADFILSKFHIVSYNIYEGDTRESGEKYRDLAEKWVRKRPYLEFYVKDFNDAAIEEERFTNRAGSFKQLKDIGDGLCDVPFHKMFIDIDGTYRLCCEDWKEKVSLGNIYEQSIVDYIEDNELLREYRRKLINGDRSISPCAKCDYKCGKYGKENEMKNYKKMVEMGDY